MSGRSNRGRPRGPNQPGRGRASPETPAGYRSYAQFLNAAAPDGASDGDAEAWMQWAQGPLGPDENAPEASATQPIRLWTEENQQQLAEDRPAATTVAGPSSVVEPPDGPNSRVNSADTICPYCQEAVQIDDTTFVHNPGCLQVLHTKCLNDAVERGDGRCPLCRETIAEPLTAEQRWERFNRIFECYARQQDDHPGYRAQRDFWSTMTALRSTNETRLQELQQDLQNQREHLQQGLAMKLHVCARTQDSQRRELEMREDKQELQGIARDPVQLQRLEERLAREYDTYEIESTEAMEQQWHACQTTYWRFEQEAADYFRHRVEMAWQALARQKEADPLKFEWEDIPFPL